MYFTAKIDKPEEVKVTITATLPLSKWKEIRVSLDEARKQKGVWSPEFDFTSKIDKVVSDLESQIKLNTEQ